jgi:hypothetical protein
MHQVRNPGSLQPNTVFFVQKVAKLVGDFYLVVVPFWDLSVR